MNEPKEWIRNYFIQLHQEALWSFGGENTGNQIGVILLSMNNKLWRFRLNFLYDFSCLDIRELRGGPALRNDGQYSMEISVGSNSTKDFYAGIVT